ncbi:branched-chain amino acid ABC transporter permease [Actinokineospora sp. NBRC 105648]|uniref:branched-chain amino acid ABC transporter permease n=1 Tax=Actinokineospora sp. NBRC 105648 TaxID=3032206 RepID=UPI0024A09AA2|nr:branched-chain amino acid ABC transporter permease [Actinokineospora sp. NBRC 105648]GLZ42897.1 branched-chain amino acid ABC transporter permease [Actinokineospora sp. NBRC 105648]
MTSIWSGLAIGAVYALVGIGYNLVFIAYTTFNFAHAQLMMFGVFVTYWGLVVAELPVLLVLLIAAVVVGLVALVEELIAIRPVKGIHAHLVTTLGMATLLDGVTRLIWGDQVLKVPPAVPDATWTVLGGRVSVVEVGLIACVIAVTAALTVYSRRSLTGLAMLAMAEDRDAALLRGIDVKRLALGVFVFAGVLAGATGPLVGPKTFAVATLGAALALKGFVAVAIGGFGSLHGALIGGFVVGLVESLTGRWLGSQFPTIAVFAVLVLILLLKPAGLFGTTRERVV